MRYGTKISSEVLERLIRFHGEKLVFPTVAGVLSYPRLYRAGTSENPITRVF